MMGGTCGVVDARVVGDVLTADTMQELTVLPKHHHAVTMPQTQLYTGGLGIRGGRDDGGNLWRC